MDRKAKIINFPTPARTSVDALEEIVAQCDDLSLVFPPLLFESMGASVRNSEEEEDTLIFINASHCHIEGLDGKITVAVSDLPWSLARLLENGISQASGHRLPFVRNVEVLLLGDPYLIKSGPGLAAIGIQMKHPDRIRLDKNWEKTGFGRSLHFRTEIWRGHNLILETTLKAEKMAAG